MTAFSAETNDVQSDPIVLAVLVEQKSSAGLLFLMHFLFKRICILLEGKLAEFFVLLFTAITVEMKS